MNRLTLPAREPTTPGRFCGVPASRAERVGDLAEALPKNPPVLDFLPLLLPSFLSFADLHEVIDTSVTFFNLLRSPKTMPFACAQHACGAGTASVKAAYTRGLKHGGGWLPTGQNTNGNPPPPQETHLPNQVGFSLTVTQVHPSICAGAEVHFCVHAFSCAESTHGRGGKQGHVCIARTRV